jgi:WD40 repeat protein
VPLGQHQRSFRPHATIFSADFSGDGKFVITGSRMVRIFNADPSGKSYGRSLYNLQMPHVVSCVAFSPEIGRYRFLAASRDGTAKIWEWFPEDDKVTEVAALTGHKGVILHAVWSPQGDRLLTVGVDDTPRIWTEQTGKMISTELPVDQEVDYDFVCAAFSADGNWVAAGASSNASDGIIGWVWKLDENKQYQQHSSVTESPEGLRAIGFVPGVDPGTQRLVTGSGNGAVTVWNVPRGFGAIGPNVLLDNFELPAWNGKTGAAHEDAVTSIDTAPDGTIVSASEDGTAVIWLEYRKTPANAGGPAAVRGGDGI